jgi:hypothetical protein
LPNRSLQPDEYFSIFLMASAISKNRKPVVSHKGTASKATRMWIASRSRGRVQTSTGLPDESFKIISNPVSRQEEQQPEKGREP